MMLSGWFFFWWMFLPILLAMDSPTLQYGCLFCIHSSAAQETASQHLHAPSKDRARKYVREAEDVEAMHTVCETALVLRVCSSSALELELSRPDANRSILFERRRFLSPSQSNQDKLGMECTKSGFMTYISVRN